MQLSETSRISRETLFPGVLWHSSFRRVDQNGLRMDEHGRSPSKSEIATFIMSRSRLDSPIGCLTFEAVPITFSVAVPPPLLALLLQSICQFTLAGIKG
jgi:hypothetical protein